MLEYFKTTLEITSKCSEASMKMCKPSFGTVPSALMILFYVTGAWTCILQFCSSNQPFNVSDQQEQQQVCQNFAMYKSIKISDLQQQQNHLAVYSSINIKVAAAAAACNFKAAAAAAAAAAVLLPGCALRRISAAATVLPEFCQVSVNFSSSNSAVRILPACALLLV